MWGYRLNNAPSNNNDDNSLIKVQKPLSFAVAQTILRPSPDMSFVRTSDHLGWSNLCAILTDERPHSMVYGGTSSLWLSIILDEADVCRTIGPKEERALLPIFTVSLLAPDTPAEVILANKIHALHVFLRSELINEVAAELFECDVSQISIRSFFNIDDAVISWLLRSVKRTLLHSEPHSNLTIDYLSRVLAVEILTKYSTIDHSPHALVLSNRLSPNQLKNVISFITDNISGNILLNDLAGIAGLSRTVFISRFKASMHQSPHQYVIQIRTKKARQQLMETDLSIVQIALNCGFSDQAHLSVIFKRIYGVPPAVFRRNVK